MPDRGTPRHVAILTHSVLPRGGVVHAIELAIALAQRGVRVDLLAPLEPGQTLFRALPAGLPVRFQALPIAKPAGRSLRDQVAERIASIEQALATWLADAEQAGQAPEVLHAQDSLTGQALARIQPHQPWVRTVHHLDDFADPDLAAWQDGAWRGASAVCTVSHAWHERLMQLAPGQPVHRVYNGVDLARFRPAGNAVDDQDEQALRDLGLMTNTPYILTVGGVEARKNSARLLEAFARLRAEVPSASQVRLVVVGGASLLQHTAEQQAWQRTLLDAGLDEGPSGAVLRTGALPDTVVPALMSHARLLAMPSLVEGFGLAAIEALACCTPVLVSQRAPFTEHLARSPGVAWCDPEDPASIALGLARAWCMGRLSAVPDVCHAHGWQRSAAIHQAVYRHTQAQHERACLPSVC
jgi:glycosyltransferase-like protein